MKNQKKYSKHLASFNWTKGIYNYCVIVPKTWLKIRSKWCSTKNALLVYNMKNLPHPKTRF